MRRLLHCVVQHPRRKHPNSCLNPLQIVIVICKVLGTTVAPIGSVILRTLTSIHFISAP